MAILCWAAKNSLSGTKMNLDVLRYWCIKLAISVQLKLQENQHVGI
jgi:hypothetical protein